jgi:cytochrome c-type biogenesis protein CcmH/NrfF
MSRFLLRVSALVLVPSILLLSVAYAFQGGALTGLEKKRLSVLLHNFRCTACEEQPVGVSHTDFAKEMRNSIVTMMRLGQSDSNIEKKMTKQYGYFVRYKPAAYSGFVLFLITIVALFLLFYTLRVCARCVLRRRM